MKKMKKEMKIGLCGMQAHICASTGLAATGTSGEFRMDLSGMGPWEMRTATASEAISYSSAWATNALDGANAVVKVYPAKREKPKYIAIDLSGGTAATHYPIEYLDEIPGGSWSDEYKTSKLVLRHIPAGSFIMGGRATDYPGAVNTNLHMVTLTKDFYMGVFEVTQRQWELVMGNRPSAASNTLYYAMRPVEMVSYMDIRGDNDGQNWPRDSKVDEESFMGVIRRKTFLTSWDLPTSAQWEYACRAGTDTGLNSGKNALYRAGVDENASEVARYSSNSGHSSTTFDLGGAPSTCTAIVGSYLPNNYGLFDMHGNVHERVLDGAVMSTESIDPVGSDLRNSRWCRGGGWQSEQHVIVAGNCSSWAPQRRTEHHGFRLCLQGGEIPEVAEGVQLVNAAGEGTANWTPTKAGTYYLTHETQTNGVNGAELLGAWFKVAGPELTFTPDGDLVPGVKIAINGAGEGWHVHYTLDGSAPTQSSASEYTAPITLNDSQTIRAIAFSNGGLESREFSATFSLMSIGSAVAKPRYPWNGKVDIDCEVKGDANLDYLVSLMALDLDGGINLPVRTAWLSGGSTTNNAFLVKPGTYRFTWNADADIAGDHDFPNVAVSVQASSTAITGAKRVVTFTVDGYTGTETLTNVPVLVRLSTAISGFSYADFADANGGDMVFCDESESVIYPHEIDEWHVGGESLVWVKLPTMAKGTRFKMAYGNSQLTTCNPQLSSHEVWRDYAGVWHMNEDSGTAFDSTAHGLDALPSKGTNTLADTSQMVACQNGACGRARVNGREYVTNGIGPGMLVPSYDALQMNSQFTVSGWFLANVITNYPRLISRKLTHSDNNGFEIHSRPENSSTSIVMRGAVDASNGGVMVDIPDLTSGWCSILVAFNGTTLTCYTNGVISVTADDVGATDNGVPLAFGNLPNCGDTGQPFIGQYDEIRLRGGTLSADRIKADYDMIKNRDFLTYGPVESGRGATE